jgi:hypothetical protein
LLTAVVVALILLLVLLAYVAHLLTTRSVLAGALRERVLVTLKSGEGFDGVLLRADRRSWELVQARAVRAGQNGADVPVDGSLIIPADNVAYAQRP